MNGWSWEGNEHDQTGYAVNGAVRIKMESFKDFHAIKHRAAAIQLAREAGLVGFGDDSPYADKLSRFAALVAAAEREACAADCDAAVARLQACPSSPENGAAVSALKHRAAAIRARGWSK